MEGLWDDTWSVLSLLFLHVYTTLSGEGGEVTTETRGTPTTEKEVRVNVCRGFGGSGEEGSVTSVTK